MTLPNAISRSRVWWFRIAIAILVLGEGYLLLSGRLAASYRSFNAPPAASPQGGGPDPEFFDHFLTNVLWIAFLAPVGLTVLWIGNRDRSASAGAAYWRAIKTVFGVAWNGVGHEQSDDEGDTAIEEDPLGALMKAFGAPRSIAWSARGRS